MLKCKYCPRIKTSFYSNSTKKTINGYAFRAERERERDIVLYGIVDCLLLKVQMLKDIDDIDLNNFVFRSCFLANRLVLALHFIAATGQRE